MRMNESPLCDNELSLWLVTVGTRFGQALSFSAALCDRRRSAARLLVILRDILRQLDDTIV